MHGQQQTAVMRFFKNGHGLYKEVDDALWMVDWKKYGLPHCTLYVVSTDSLWPCKVGISVAPRKRIVSLQTSVWRPLHVADCMWMPTVAEAKRLEGEVHRRLAEDGKWLHGEWFDLRAKEAADLVRFTADVVGIECRSTVPEGPVRADMSHMLSWAQVSDNLVAHNQKRYAEDNEAWSMAER